MPFADPLVAATTLVRDAIRSEGYVAGSSGWIIERDGDAEFNDVTVRGTIAGSTITGTYFRSDAADDTEYIVIDDGDLQFFDGGDLLIAELNLDDTQVGLHISTMDAAATGFESFLQLISGKDTVDAFPSALYNNGARPTGIYQQADNQTLDLRATGSGSDINIQAANDDIGLRADRVLVDADTVLWRDELLQTTLLTLSWTASAQLIDSVDGLEVTAADHLDLNTDAGDITLDPTGGAIRLWDDSNADVYLESSVGTSWLRANGSDTHKVAIGFVSDPSTAASAVAEVKSANHGSYRDINASDFNVSSDRTLKRDVTDVTDEDRAALAELRARRFVRDDDEDQARTPEVGFIAQDLPAILRKRGADGSETYALAGLVALMWEELRDLRARVEAL